MNLLDLTPNELIELLSEEYFKDFDPAIDGSLTNQEDIAAFLEPYLNTLALKQHS